MTGGGVELMDPLFMVFFLLLGKLLAWFYMFFSKHILYIRSMSFMGLPW